MAKVNRDERTYIVHFHGIWPGLGKGNVGNMGVCYTECIYILIWTHIRENVVTDLFVSISCIYLQIGGRRRQSKHLFKTTTVRCRNANTNRKQTHTLWHSAVVAATTIILSSLLMAFMHFSLHCLNASYPDCFRDDEILL